MKTILNPDQVRAIFTALVEAGDHNVIDSRLTVPISKYVALVGEIPKETVRFVFTMEVVPDPDLMGDYAICVVRHRNEVPGAAQLVRPEEPCSSNGQEVVPSSEL